jgi:hypothetical protein
MSHNIFVKNNAAVSNHNASSVAHNKADSLRKELNNLLEEANINNASLPNVDQFGGKRRKTSKKVSRKLTGGKKGAKNTKVTKVSKSSKKSSRKLSGGKPKKIVMAKSNRKPSKKSSRKPSKKSSRRLSGRSVGGARELPAGMVAHQEFVKFLKNDMNLSGGPLVNMLAKAYKDLAKNNNADADSVELAKLAKDVYLKEKSSGQPKKRIDELEKRLKENRSNKKAKKANTPTSE